MLIESRNEYIPSLTELWHRVFGDSEEYIKLFFDKAYYDCECFAEIDGEKIISAFYLLKCCIKSDGNTYNGRYLYAAATLPEYRSKGTMSKLIRQAIIYCKSQDLDFIALVPADDGLYDYYSRFHFAEAMYKYRLKIDSPTSTMRSFGVINGADEFCKIRNTADCDMLVYNKIGTEYAFNCLRYSGTEIFALSDNAYYAVGEELFCGDNKDIGIAGTLINNLCGETEIFTNIALDGAEKIRNGMIYSFRNDVKFKDIYMNIALD